MKRKIWIGIGALFTTILGVLGVIAIGGPLAQMEYGAPHATFRISGQVRSSTSNRGIPAIRVQSVAGETMTDTDGRYRLEMTVMLFEDTISVSATDVDGDTNGAYLETSVPINVRNVPWQGGNGKWDYGMADRVLDIDLTPKPSEMPGRPRRSNRR